MQGKIFLACGLVVLVFVSTLGGLNWRSNIGETQYRASTLLVVQAVQSYNLWAAEREYQKARELIENDNYAGAISKLSTAENYLNSFADNTYLAAKTLSFLPDDNCYNALIISTQNLVDNINSLIENLRVETVQQPLIGHIGGSFENLQALHLLIFAQEGTYYAKPLTLLIVNSAGQYVEVKG
jgi:hypothetical protein